MLAVVELFSTLLHALVVFIHLDFVILNPTFLDGLVLLILGLFELDLCVSFLEDIAEEHTSVEGFNLILRVMHFLGGILKGLLAFLLLECFLLRIDASSLKLYEKL